MHTTDPQPLLIDAADAAAADAPDVVVRELTEAIAAAERTGRPFAAVVRTPAPEPPGQRQGEARRRVAMIEQMRPGLERHCRGLVFVLPPQAGQAITRLQRSAERVWGCRATATPDQGEALALAAAWLAGES